MHQPYVLIRTCRHLAVCICTWHIHDMTGNGEPFGKTQRPVSTCFAALERAAKVEGAGHCGRDWGHHHPNSAAATQWGHQSCASEVSAYLISCMHTIAFMLQVLVRCHSHKSVLVLFGKARMERTATQPCHVIYCGVCKLLFQQGLAEAEAFMFDHYPW